MTARETFVIVGAGLAGAKVAEALCSEGFDGRVVLIGEEADSGVALKDLIGTSQAEAEAR